MTGASRSAALLALLLLPAAGCGEPAAAEGIPIGVLLSYSGYLAANSVNSERALTLAIEAGNAAGGVGGQPVRLVARNTRSDPAQVVKRARELIQAGAVLFIGPDTIDFVTQLRTLLGDRTMILPSFATASDIEWKPPFWFVMGASTARVACELMAQMRADGREKPVMVVNSTGYNGWLSWVLTNEYGMRKVLLPANQPSTPDTVLPITEAGADAYVLAAYPASASALLYALLARKALPDASRWYLSPTLHTPAFLQSSPRTALAGARVIAPSIGDDAADFRERFAARWHDQPLDDAYAFYDAGAVAVLALQRAFTREGAIPDGHGLASHIVAVTQRGATAVRWNELDRGLALLASGQEIEYVGVSGLIEFDLSGQTPAASTVWWTIDDDRFAEAAQSSRCGR